MQFRYDNPILPVLLAGLCATALWGVPFLAQEAKPDNLEPLVRKALDANPGLRAQRQRVLAAEQVAPQARALPDPMADVEFMNLSVTRPDLKNALTEGISVGVTQVLPYPGKRAAAQGVARGEAEVERARLKVMESGLRGEVAATAYRIAALRDLLALNGETREALQTASQTAASVYASGRGSQADVLLAQSAETRIQARRAELESEGRIARDRMASLLGGDFGESELLALALPEPSDTEPLEHLLKKLPDVSPEVGASRAEEEVGASRVEVARLASKPDFTVGARYRYRDMTMGGGDYLTAMVGISLPFFHRKDRYQPALQEAFARRESARYATEETLNQSRYKLSAAYERAVRANRVYVLTREGLLIQAAQAYESSMASYQAGKADFGALLVALTQLYEAQGDAIMAQVDYQEARAEMESILGEPGISSGDVPAARLTVSPSPGAQE